MPILLTSLILCLFQAQDPAVSLKGSSSAYTKAMHLIDVRGKYLEGAELLESIADAPDTINFQGQSSWILAQSARAYTLAGKPELASMDLDLIRSASRNTPFEGAVQELLLTFADQGSGLDEEFLDHIWQHLGTSRGRDQLYYDFGTDMLPYLRFLLNNVDHQVNLSDRSGALQIAFTILDMESVDWMTEFLLTETLVSKKVLAQIIPQGDGYQNRFSNSEARSALAKVFLNLSNTVDESELDAVLDHLIAILQWQVSLSDPEKDASTTEEVYSKIIQLLEAGYFGSNNKGLDYIVDGSGNKGSGFLPLALRIANSEDLELRHQMRWLLANNEFAKGRIKEWALEGGDEDMLRLCLAKSNWSNLIFHRESSSDNQDFVAWAWTELNAERPQFSLPKHVKRWVVNKRDLELELEVLSGMTSAKNPLIRYLAANTLLNHSKQREAVAFLLELGEDPTWASFFLNHWTQSTYNKDTISPESLEILEPLARNGTLTKEVRLLLEANGRAIMTKRLWSELDLNPSDSVLNSFKKRAVDSNDFDGLLWLMLNSNPETPAASESSRIFAEKDPRGYLAAIPQLEKAGLRWDYFSAEWLAWETGARMFGSPFFAGSENRSEEFLLHLLKIYPDSGALLSLLGFAPDPILAFFAKHLDDDDIMSALHQSARALSFENLQYPSEAIHFSMALLKTGHEEILFDNSRFFGHLFNPKLEETQDFLTLFWAAEPPAGALSTNLLHSTISNPELRSRFHDPMSQLLQSEAWAVQVCIEYETVGAVDEILDDILLAIENSPTPPNLAKYLHTIRAVDDPRVVEVLMQHLEDPRPLVLAAAAESLDHLRKSRVRKQEWSAWASGNGAASPVAALLQDLKDPEKGIRLAAITSLGTLHSIEALPALVNLLRDADEDIKSAARKSLARINAEPTVPKE